MLELELVTRVLAFYLHGQLPAFGLSWKVLHLLLLVEVGFALLQLLLDKLH